MTNELEKQFKKQVLHILYGIIVNSNVYNYALAHELVKLEKIIEEQINDSNN